MRAPWGRDRVARALADERQDELVASPGAVADGTAGALEGRHLLRGSHSLLANTILTSALGIVFWILAARLCSQETVGRDTVLISVMVELSVICQLDMQNAILRFLPDFGPRTTRALLGVYLLTGALAVLAGIAFATVSPSISGSLAFLGSDPALGAVFVLALGLWGAFVLQDAALTAVRRAPWVAVENGAFGAAKLLALALMAWAGLRHAVFLAWVIPVAPLVLLVNRYLVAHAIPAHNRAAVPVPGRLSSLRAAGLGGAGGFLARDYLASVLSQATLTVLPVLAIALLGARQSAYFTIPFGIALAFDALAAGAASPLLVESTLQPGREGELARLFIARLVPALLGGCALLALAAPLVLLAFGSDYARHGTSILRLLLAASALRVLLATFTAGCRARGRSGRLIATAVLTLGSALAVVAVVGGAHGGAGIALAWLLANAIACCYAAPTLVRWLRT